MKNIIKLLVICFIQLMSGNLIAQRQNLVDSLTNEICKTMLNSKEKNDSIRLFESARLHLMPVLKEFTKREGDSIGENIYFRLQRNCPIFKTLLESGLPPNQYWKTVYERPVSKLSNKECLQFRKQKAFQYHEHNGDIVNLKIDDETWVDNFNNGTFSRLKVYWGQGCSFDIEFIESNNTIRKQFSKPGEKYRYTILEKADDYYLMCVEITGVERFSIFKLYYRSLL